MRERYVLIHSLASQVMPDVEQLMPASLPLLQTQLSRIDQERREAGRTPPAPPEPLPSTAGVKDNVEKMLDIASRVTNPQVRDGVYARAALSLYLHGDYERALEKAKPSAELASALLGIARSYLENDRTKALAITSEAIRTINAAEGEQTWELLRSGNSGRLAAQNPNWTTGRGGIVTHFSATYPQIAGLLDVLSKVSTIDLDEGLMLARQLKSKGLSYTAQAILCRQAIERAQQQNKGAASKGKPRSE